MSKTSQQTNKKLANYVFLLNKDKTPLGLIHPGYVRKLLTNGFASVFRTYPFVVILKYQTDFVADSYQIKIDPGSKTTGFAILRGNQVLFAMELEHRGNLISKGLADRKSRRRDRRNRKTRYRRCKFFNKKNRKGAKHSKPSIKVKLQPSILHRSLTIQTWIKRFVKFCPISNASLELVRFDTQKMSNPDINGVQYQQGTLQGYEVREYILERDNRKCVYCSAEGSDKIHLQLDHIIPRSQGGSDRVSNLVLACDRCNLKKSDLDVVDFLRQKFRLSLVEAEARAKQIKKHALTSLKDAAAVNSSRKETLTRVSELLPTETGSGAQTKMNRNLQGIPKFHWTDAACVGDTPKLIFRINQPLLVKCQGHGTRQDIRPDKYGFPTGWRKKEGSTFFGFKTGDLVKADVPQFEISLIPEFKPATKRKPSKTKWKYKKMTFGKAGTYVGRVACRASGSFNVGCLKSKVEGISYRFCKKLHSCDGYDYCFPKSKIGGLSLPTLQRVGYLVPQAPYWMKLD